MVPLFLEKFGQLPRVARSMIMLFWLYYFFQLTTDIFVSVYLVIRTQSLVSLVLFRWVLFLGAFFGFGVGGVVFSGFKKPMKSMYISGFVGYALSCCFLLLSETTMASLVIFSLIQGFSLGMFWLGVHSHELHFITDTIRDFYSSIQHAGANLLKIIIPGISTGLVLLAEHLGYMELSLVFVFLFLLTFFAFPIAIRMPSFIPDRYRFADVFGFRKELKSKATLTYYISTSYKGEALLIAASVMAYFVLSDIVKIGIWESIVGIIAVIFTLLLAPIRSNQNRQLLLLIGLFGVSCAALFLALAPYHILFYALYSVFLVVFNPLINVSEHTIHLRRMEIAGGASRSYISMLYREWVLFSGRTVSMLLMILPAIWINNPRQSVLMAICFFLALTLTTYLSARKIRG